MQKTLLKDLKKKIFIRSSMLAVSSLDEIFGLNDYLSPDEVLLEIIKKALSEFEISNPLILEMKVCKDQMGTCYGRQGYSEIKSNFTLYLDCMISEDQIILVPTVTPYLRLLNSYPAPGSWYPATDYQAPYLFTQDIPFYGGQFWIRGICSRPIIPDFTPDGKFNEASTKSAIYWLNVEEGALGTYFMDLCMVHVLDYIRQLKASIQLPSMSVDVLGNIDTAYQELRARCDQYQLQSSWYGGLLV